MAQQEDPWGPAQGSEPTCDPQHGQGPHYGGPPSGDFKEVTATPFLESLFPL